MATKKQRSDYKKKKKIPMTWPDLNKQEKLKVYYEKQSLEVLIIALNNLHMESTELPNVYKSVKGL